jgi:hypothetical protein
MGTIGFGRASEYSRIRIPKPPQKSTTFIVASEFFALSLTLVGQLGPVPLRLEWAPDDTFPTDEHMPPDKFLDHFAAF